MLIYLFAVHMSSAINFPFSGEKKACCLVFLAKWIIFEGFDFRGPMPRVFSLDFCLLINESLSRFVLYERNILVIFLWLVLVRNELLGGRLLSLKPNVVGIYLGVVGSKRSSHCKVIIFWRMKCCEVYMCFPCILVREIMNELCKSLLIVWRTKSLELYFRISGKKRS